MALQTVARLRSVGEQHLVRDPGFDEGAILLSEFGSVLTSFVSETLKIVETKYAKHIKALLWPHQQPHIQSQGTGAV